VAVVEREPWGSPNLGTFLLSSQTRLPAAIAGRREPGELASRVEAAGRNAFYSPR
jgi:hypothetical protein